MRVVKMPNRPSFPIPENINAEPFCLCIKVPNDPTWKSVVAGLLDELNQWYNWQRDEARSGKECAQVWRNLYNEIDWSIMSCCCDGTNPTLYQWSSTFILQISVDGGVTWVNAPQLDPRNNSPVWPPVPGDSSDGKKCIAATGMMEMIKEQVGDNLTDDMSRYTLAELINDWVNTLINSGGNIFSGLVTVITNQIFALVVSAIRPALTEEVYDLLKCAFLCNMSDDLSFSESQWETVRSEILASIPGIAGVFLEHLVFLLGKMGITNMARAQYASSGNCGDCGCVSGCSPTNWDVITGTLISVTDTLMVIEPLHGEDGKYYSQISSGNMGNCCTLAFSGNDTLHWKCGEADGTYYYGGTTGVCAWKALISHPASGNHEYHFTPCPE